MYPLENVRGIVLSETNNSFFLSTLIESEASYAIVVGLENEDDGMFPPKNFENIYCVVIHHSGTFNQFCFLAVLCGIGWIPIKDGI